MRVGVRVRVPVRLARLAEAILDEAEAHVHAALVAEGGVGVEVGVGLGLRLGLGVEVGVGVGVGAGVGVGLRLRLGLGVVGLDLVAEGAVLEQLDRANEILLGARQVAHRRVRVPYVLAQRGGGAHDALLG